MPESQCPNKCNGGKTPEGRECTLCNPGGNSSVLAAVPRFKVPSASGPQSCFLWFQSMDQLAVGRIECRTVQGRPYVNSSSRRIKKQISTGSLDHWVHRLRVDLLARDERIRSGALEVSSPTSETIPRRYLGLLRPWLHQHPYRRAHSGSRTHHSRGKLANASRRGCKTTIVVGAANDAAFHRLKRSYELRRVEAARIERITEDIILDQAELECLTRHPARFPIARSAGFCSPPPPSLVACYCTLAPTQIPEYSGRGAKSNKQAKRPRTDRSKDHKQCAVCTMNGHVVDNCFYAFPEIKPRDFRASKSWSTLAKFRIDNNIGGQSTDQLAAPNRSTGPTLWSYLIYCLV
ncbi:hypothetical protein QBC40DRAFT_348842 [Triangularia verruculosa]|uniref:Uncharacterized protein n=1 Tax=Triangularia verruculosa TaxID=2587418 RepID=A0AAN6XHE8_9PEZI|nr:hypothetical protein QBC40DRAFT_348842 [Triangularia verruculosa]